MTEWCHNYVKKLQGTTKSQLCFDGFLNATQSDVKRTFCLSSKYFCPIFFQRLRPKVFDQRNDRLDKIGRKCFVFSGKSDHLDELLLLLLLMRIPVRLIRISLTR